MGEVLKVRTSCHRRPIRCAERVAQRIHAGYVLVVEQVEALTQQLQLRLLSNREALGDAQVEDVGLRLREGVAPDAGNTEGSVRSVDAATDSR